MLLLERVEQLGHRVSHHPGLPTPCNAGE
jgi:hypothetical protein